MKDIISYRFIADVHLGRLAKWLRLLGFDVLYANDATPATLIKIAQAEDRILLSKWTGFTQQSSLRFLQIKSSNSLKQLQQVIEYFHLKNTLQPFTHCLICNGHLQPVSKATVESELLLDTNETCHNFWQCDSCKRIYWEGSHYERMLQLVEQVRNFKD